MRFGAAGALALLALVPVFGVLAWAALASHRRRLRRFAATPVLPRLLLGASTGRYLVRTILRIAALGLAVLALARPQWGRRDEPVVRRGVDVVLAMDLSVSMLAEDVSPNRLEQARAQARSLIDALGGDRVALVVFGGRASVQCPLTLDYGAVRLFVDAAEPDFAPGPGSDIGRAIDEARRLYDTSERRYKTLVILSDGEDLEGGAERAAGRAQAEGIVIHAIGVGTTRGGPIPLRNASGVIEAYKKDRQERVVTTRLDPASLEKVALATGGLFLAAGPAGEEGRRIAQVIDSMDKKEVSSRLATRLEDRFQIPLACALALLALESLWIGRRPRDERNARGRNVLREEAGAAVAAGRTRARGRATAATVALIAVAVLSLGRGAGPAAAAGEDPAAPEGRSERPGEAAPSGSPARRGAPAGEHGGPPHEEGSPPADVARRTRDGNRLYAGKKYSEALSRYEAASAAAPELPSLRYNIGNALYRQGKYDAAASEYARALARAGASLAPAARFNLGNARYQQGRYGEAVDAFRNVLEQHPRDDAARHNLELALRALEQKKQQQQSSSDQGQSQKDENRPKEGQGKPRETPPKPGQEGSKGEGQEEGRPEDQQRDPGDASPDGSQKPGETPGQKGSQGARKPPSESRIGRKEAENLLDSLAQEEMRDLKKRLARLPRDAGPEKDW